jgi:hypothetical protein
MRQPQTMKTLSKVSLPPTAEEQALLDELREYKAQRDALLTQRDELLGALRALRDAFDQVEAKVEIHERTLRAADNFDCLPTDRPLKRATGMRHSPRFRVLDLWVKIR